MMQDSDIQLQLYLKQLRQQRSALQPISCSMCAHHAADEDDALVSYLFQCYQENCKTGTYGNSLPCFHASSCFATACWWCCMMTIQQIFISMIALKSSCISKEGNPSNMAGFVHTSYERLQEQLMQLKECPQAAAASPCNLQKQLCSALLLSIMRPLPAVIMVYRKGTASQGFHLSVFIKEEFNLLMKYNND